MSDSRFSIGPGNMDMCRECVERNRVKQDYDHKIADWVTEHPEVQNGHDDLKDWVKLRRGQRE